MYFSSPLSCSYPGSGSCPINVYRDRAPLTIIVVLAQRIVTVPPNIYCIEDLRDID